MKATVCEMPNDRVAFETAWTALCAHCQDNGSDFLLLPEMIFSEWLADNTNENDADWEASIQSHHAWIKRLPELGTPVVAGSRPLVVKGKRYNMGFVWSRSNGLVDVHAKRYLPEEPGFWEATWHSRGAEDFRSVQTEKGNLGFLICTELWFNQHARDYGKDGVQMVVCPRATESRTVEKWLVGGRAAAVVSGAYCLSSNRYWNKSIEGDVSALGWIIEPVNGDVLGVTSSSQPFFTLDIELAAANRAKETYPRYVIG